MGFIAMGELLNTKRKVKTNLVPDDNTVYMRGFSNKRFSTSIDGMTIRKTGGRKSSHIVNYALLPPWMFESMEVKPGPHFAAYPGKSIGGVLNLISKTPEKHESLKPDVNFGVSYGSYNTLNNNMNLSCGAGNFIYDFGYQKYHTDGYLRHTKFIDYLYQDEQITKKVVKKLKIHYPKNTPVASVLFAGYRDKQKIIRAALGTILENHLNNHNLKREICLFSAIIIVVANIIGTGIFITSGFIMEELGNPQTMLLCWLIGGLFALSGALCYGELGAMFPKAGGEYIFLRESYGRGMAFLSGWIFLIVGFSASIAAAAIAFASYLLRVLPVLLGFKTAVSLGGFNHL